MSKRKKKKNRPPKPSKGAPTTVVQDETLAPGEPEEGEDESRAGDGAESSGSDTQVGETSSDEVGPVRGEDVAAQPDSLIDGDLPSAEGAEVSEETPSAEGDTAVEVALSESMQAMDESAVVDEPVAEAATDVAKQISAEGAVEVEASSSNGSDLTEATTEEDSSVFSTESSESISTDGEWSADAAPMAEATNEEFAAAWSDAASSEGVGEPSEVVGEEGAPLPADGTLAEGSEAPLEGFRLESVVESLLFTSDKALGVADLKKLIGEKDAKKITQALDSLVERRKGTGIEVVRLSSGWHMRTNAENAPWVSKLLQGKPMRLTRAMMETLAIVAYRQPVTRPEIDDIRGVDCGPVLKTLLERGLIRIIGKKEEVGRPMLYGSTPEFLRVFNLRDLSELPTLREFYDLSSENQSKVEAEHGPTTPSATSPKPEVAMGFVSRSELPPEPEEDDPLLEEIDRATAVAKKALGDAQEPAPDEEGKPESEPPPAET